MTRPITEWVEILEPMTAQQAANFILEGLDREHGYVPQGVGTAIANNHVALANALTAWAMLAKAEDQS
jgi:hypothetical protein